jgi:hypothetical protein
MDSLLKKYNILFITITLFVFSCKQAETKQAQYISADKSFSLDGSNHIASKVNEKNPDDISLETHITPLKDSLHISWQILKQDFPASWEYSFCDNTSCYFELPKNNTLNVITKSNCKDEGALKLQVNTSGVKGSGSLVLLLQNKSQNTCDTLYFEAEF